MDAQRVLERLSYERARLVTAAEQLQEIVHRYTAIDRRDATQPAFDALLGIVNDVVAVDLRATQSAKAIVPGSRTLSARDAIHLAVMQQHAVSQTFSFDPGFDGQPGITRLA